MRQKNIKNGNKEGNKIEDEKNKKLESKLKSEGKQNQQNKQKAENKKNQVNKQKIENKKNQVNKKETENKNQVDKKKKENKDNKDNKENKNNKENQEKTESKEKDIEQKENEKNDVTSKKLPKEVKSRILKNLLVAVMVVAYFLILILAHQNMRPERLAGDIEIFAIAYLGSGLIVLERAYKKDDGKLAITSIELLVLSFHTLSINHMVNILKSDFSTYLLISSGAFSIYFILKTIIIYTKDRKQYLNSLSDISEIVNEDKPIIKEATKKTKKANVVNNENDIKTQGKKDISKKKSNLKDNDNKKDKANKTANKRINSKKDVVEGKKTTTQKNKVIKDTNKKENEKLNTKKAKTTQKNKKEVNKND